MTSSIAQHRRTQSSPSARRVRVQGVIPVALEANRIHARVAFDRSVDVRDRRLRRAPVIVVKAAEDRERHNASLGSRRPAQFVVRIRNRTDPLMTACAVVITDVLGDHASHVCLAEKHEMIESVAPKCRAPRKPPQPQCMPIVFPENYRDVTPRAA